MALSLSNFFLFLSFALHCTSALTARPPIGAISDVAAATPFLADFTPRFYKQGIPAEPAQPLSPNPGHVLSGYKLGSQRTNQCPAGSHSCVEANAPGSCCPNDRYCYLDQSWAPKCCELGVKCPGSPCGPDELYGNFTSTATVPFHSSTTTSGGSLVTSLLSYSTFAACGDRPCHATMFQCETFYGGQCCGYGYKCALDSQCITDPVPSTTMSTVAFEIPSGCAATSQFSCTDGGGCCNSGEVCTFQSIAPATSSPVCSPMPSKSSGGLSTGAKAGVGVGVALGAALVIGAATWLCIRRRWLSGVTDTNAAAHGLQGIAGVMGRNTPGSVHTGPATVLSEPTSASPYPPLHDHGRAYSYLGPDAVAGPFTEDSPDPYSEHATTPPTAPLLSDNYNGQAATPGSMPFHPDHIMRPVEMSSADPPIGSEVEGETGDAKTQIAGESGRPNTEIYELMDTSSPPMNLKERSQSSTTTTMTTTAKGPGEREQKTG
ncbi:hypothetical protein GGR50DRAFT_695266 [Xylaria sp. CBS 124048]|nr:hypothetical protein GGR50DRAFT_695266 [Xylaria sp. CBS 124048]